MFSLNQVHGESLTALWLAVIVEGDLEWSHCLFTETLLALEKTLRNVASNQTVPPMCRFFSGLDSFPMDLYSLRQYRLKMLQGMPT